jgi:hypothetical protein
MNGAQTKKSLHAVEGFQIKPLTIKPYPMKIQRQYITELLRVQLLERKFSLKGKK